MPGDPVDPALRHPGTGQHRATVFARHGADWVVHALFAEDILRLPEIEVELPFTDIYADVQLPPQSDDAAASGPSGSL
jgi:hypothetical protein